MAGFKLMVVTPSGVIYDSDVENLTVRTVSGDIGILAGHANYVAPLAIGAMKVIADGVSRIAAVSNGMIRVDKDKTTIITNTCEWADEIDVERAKLAKERAMGYLDNPTSLHTQDVAQAKLARALNRIEIAGKR